MKKLVIGIILLSYASIACAVLDHVWYVKAINQQGNTLDITAFYNDDPHQRYPVRAVTEEDVDGEKILDVKILNDNDTLHAHVKVIKGENNIHDVEGVTDQGTILQIKAIDTDGQLLDLKAFPIHDNEYDIKAIGPNAVLYTVKAFSPFGRVYDIKGIKVGKDDVELLLGQQPIYAHVKAIPLHSHIKVSPLHTYNEEPIPSDASAMPSNA